MTILQAIKQVMKERGVPLTPKEAYAGIISSKLYEFHADDPLSVVRIEIRKHCLGVDFPSASKTKHFKMIENKYFVLEDIVKLAGESSITSNINCGAYNDSNTEEVQKIISDYISKLKQRVLDDLLTMKPDIFEKFSQKLMAAYGFYETNTTKTVGDGGIDGYGKLKVGLASLNVAFQCKRWKSNIQRTEIDKFRGAIQGEYEQGVFFTTSSFSKGAIDASIKKGAVPIVLIDGRAIVDLMLDKKFGFQTETILLPTYSLDLVLDD